MVMFHPTKVPHMGFPRRVGTEGLWFKRPAPFGWRYGRVFSAMAMVQVKIWDMKSTQSRMNKCEEFFLDHEKLDRENMDVKIVKIITSFGV